MNSPLSSPLSGIKDRYDVVVAGSGYGGAIAASRMARAGLSVCLLERGRERRPGEYPDTVPEALAEIQVNHRRGHAGSRTGLLDLRMDDELSVLVGCGLGGTSLINANVALRADPRILDDSRWPAALRADRDGLLEAGYRRAEEMLRPAPLPERLTLRKLDALERSGRALGGRFYRPPLNVAFEDGVNHVGVEQRACTLCGDCVSGCNHGAKSTTLVNYLPDARNFGAELYTRTAVRSVDRRDGRWLVRYQMLDTGRERFDAPEPFVEADLVILACGTLGSTEVLLRSAARGLPLSERLGERFSGNGDVLAFAYNADSAVDGVGWGEDGRRGRPPVGPSIAGIVDLRDAPSAEDGIAIEEGAIPGAVAPLLPAAMAAAARMVGRDTDGGVPDLVSELGREWESLIHGPYRGALTNTLTYLVMGHDDAGGRLLLEDDRLRLDWPGVGDQPVFERIAERLERAVRPLGATYLRNPLWSRLLGLDLVSVHPLGGCPMAEDAADGVVDDRGRVFAGAAGDAVHEGLYVCDGAVVPRALGVNPLLTISALAERSCALIAAERGREIDYALPSAPRRRPPAARLGIEFTERMRGHVSTRVTDSYEAAAKAGEDDGSPLEFTLTIATDDLDRMLEEPEHEARMLGTVTAPALAAEPLTVTDGVFNLLDADPERPGARRMRYRMRLTAEDGRRFRFSGFKVVRDDPGPDLWSDTTTLYVDVHAEESGALAARGILRIAPEDFLRQLTTIDVTGARGVRERLAATARFGRAFAGALFDVYGGVFAGPTRFDPDAPPRKRRPLRAPAPEVHPLAAGDGAQLRLTRHRGGAKGPVVLAHGLGVSSRIFTIDTIETNLLEFLAGHGYDVWLLDYRASIELPASRAQFSADDVATGDWPAALRAVRELSGADDVQVVAHCFGATTFTMAMLAGLEGVRSAVCSQMAAHIVAPPGARLKAGLHVPAVLDALGIDSLTAYTDRRAGWLERLYDKALDLLPIEGEERCDSAVCHRITFMYSLLYEHDRLNPATHEALHELFGVANMSAFEHLALMVRRGQVVAADGSDRYLPHVERLAIPIAFVHGAENACFLPESTERTYALLRERNGPALYERHVVPGYGHIDCIYGEEAARDVYPLVLAHLERTAA